MYHFMERTRTDREDALADLLCDLRHWCDRNGKSFGRENERAARMYKVETTPLAAQDVGANPPPDQEVPF